MDGSDFTGQMSPAAAYDCRLYDRVWQRVAPELTPQPQEPAEPPSRPGELLPGAQKDPCCMGSAAQEDTQVLAAFAGEELAEAQCCLSLACHVTRRDAQRLLRSMAEEKRQAARLLRSALYLITGACPERHVAVEPMRWRCLADALRSCYHQEACGGFNYRRAADGTADPCLQKLLRQLGEASDRRAEAVLSLLGHVIDKQ